jgi:signal peptide peptidase SppA
MSDINPIMARFDGQPALMNADNITSVWFQACCQEVAAAAEKIAQVEQAADNFWFSSDDWRSAYRPYQVQKGLLTIPVKGLLLNNFSISYGSYATGYEYIWKAVQRGMNDPEVKGIVFDVDSGGGMVAGNFDLVDRIYALRGKKPMRAFTEGGAYSAAYSIASVADKIVMGRSAGVGSIGVVLTHFEQSKMLADRGITVNIIRSKPRKYEGNALEPLTDAARATMQDHVNASHQEFVAIVARNRNMKETKVDATNALCFMSEEAIEKGLADEKGTLEDAFTAFAAFVNSEQEIEPMADSNQAGITQEAHDAAVAAARVEGNAAGASAERTRVKAILESAEAADRPIAAQMFAFDMALSAEDSVAKLAKLPVETKQEATAPVQGAGTGAAAFTQAMEGTPNPDLAADGGEDEPLTGSAKILKLAAAVGIKGFGNK